jgi:hypothetical protein
VCDRETPHHRKVKLRDMEVNDIELACAAGDLFEEKHMGSERISTLASEAQRMRPYRNQTRGRL